MARRGGVLATPVRFMSCVTLCVVALTIAGCMFFKEAFRPEGDGRRAAQALAPCSSLAQAEASALLQQALADPAVQQVRAKLVARGYTPLDTPALALKYDRGALLLVPFAQASSAGDQAGEEQPGLPVKPSSRTPTPKPPAPPTPSAYPAYILYIAYSHGGKVVFGVIDEGTKAIHISPENERSLVLVLVESGDVLPQLRGNERFRKFEAAQGGIVATTTLVNETASTAYILLSVINRDPNYGTMAVGYDQRVVSQYLATCPVVTYGTSGINLDSEKLKVFHGAKLDYQEFAGDGTVVSVINPFPVYTIIAGGERPSEAGNPQAFAFYSVLPDGDNRITPAQTGGAGSRALNLFCWGLLDVPSDNVLLSFKTDAELALATYNAAMTQARYGVILAQERHDSPVLLAGLRHANVQHVQRYSAEAKRREKKTEPVWIQLETLIAVVESLTELPIRRIAELLLNLAEADTQGRFDQAYQEFLPLGLAQIGRFLVPSYHEQDQVLIRERIRRLACELIPRLEILRSESGLQPRAEPITIGSLITVISNSKAAKLVIDVLIGFATGYIVELTSGRVDYVKLTLPDGRTTSEQVDNALESAIAFFEKQILYYEKATNMWCYGYVNLVWNWLHFPNKYFRNADEKKAFYVVLWSLMDIFNPEWIKRRIASAPVQDDLRRIEQAMYALDYLEHIRRLRWMPLGAVVDADRGVVDRFVLKSEYTHTSGRSVQKVQLLGIVNVVDNPSERVSDVFDFILRASDAAACNRYYNQLVGDAGYAIAAVVFPGTQSDPNAVHLIVEAVGALDWTSRSCRNLHRFIIWEEKVGDSSVIRYWHQGTYHWWHDEKLRTDLERTIVASLTPDSEGKAIQRYTSRSSSIPSSPIALWGISMGDNLYLLRDGE